MRRLLSKRRQTDRTSPEVERETPKRLTAVIKNVDNLSVTLSYRSKEVLKKDWHDKNRGLIEIRWYFVGGITVAFVQCYEPDSWEEGNYAVHIHDETNWFKTEKALHRYLLEVLQP